MTPRCPCGTPLTRRHKHGRCTPCAKARTCACGTPIAPRNKSGRCHACSRPDVWSKDELARLDELFPAMGRLCVEHFPGRTVSAIESKAQDRGLRSEAPRGPRPARDATEHMERVVRRQKKVVNRLLHKAIELVEAGETTSRHGQTRLAMIEASKIVAERERQADPIEQAKTVLRRRYRPVVSEAVLGGDPDRFVVGSRRGLTAQDLLEMARRAA